MASLVYFKGQANDYEILVNHMAEMWDETLICWLEKMP